MTAAGSFRLHKESVMDFFRNMQQRDWIIAAIAFLAGAIIF